MPRKRPEKKPSIAKTVRQYIDRRPVVRDALALGIVNLSALTRRIMEETDIQQEEAVLVACRRYPIAKGGEGYEAAIRRVLDRSRLEVRTRVVVWILKPSWQLFTRLEKALPKMQGQNTPVHVIHGSEAVTVIADEQLDAALENMLQDDDVVRRIEGLVEVNLRTPSKVEDVPGILAFLTTSLASRGINFVEVISCDKDNMFVMEEDDLFEAFEILQGLTKG